MWPQVTPYMQFGAHVSVAGGLWNAPVNASALGCEVLQMFSRSPHGGQPKPITALDITQFTDTMQKNKIVRAYLHAPYFINLASAANRIREGSVQILRQELERGTALGVRALMFHPGSAKDLGQEEGVKAVVACLNKILNGYKGSCQLLLEISAGAGMVMGDTFEEIAAFITGAERGAEVGVCFDTQHAFASGYDLRDAKAVQETFAKFDRLVGLQKITVIHCNDSLTDFESHKDRHAHIGEGKIGAAGFQSIVQHPGLQHVDFIVETPTLAGMKKDVAFLKKCRDTK